MGLCNWAYNFTQQQIRVGNEANQEWSTCSVVHRYGKQLGYTLISRWQPRRLFLESGIHDGVIGSVSALRAHSNSIGTGIRSPNPHQPA